MDQRVEHFTSKRSGREIRCFRVFRSNGSVELFHEIPSRNTIGRGMPCFPWPDAESVTRSENLLTLANAEYLTGIKTDELNACIKKGYLRAVSKKWRYGNWPRRAWFVTKEDVKELQYRRMIEHYKGKVDWDISGAEVVRRNERKSA